MVITIDGPAGSGKSTVARRIAQRLGLQYVDTGASYRAAAWLVLSRKLDMDNEAEVRSLAQNMDYAPGPLLPDMTQRIWINGTEVTAAIRTPAVAEMTSRMAVYPAVRRVLVDVQRSLALLNSHGAVLEGRDTGTVVFPDADVKIFLVASAQERARRRTVEMAATGAAIDESLVLSQMQRRDERDATRSASPLIAAPDAHVVETDGKSIEDVVNEILAKVPAGAVGQA
jgi:cytidylate kinase